MQEKKNNQYLKKKNVPGIMLGNFEGIKYNK